VKQFLIPIRNELLFAGGFSAFLNVLMLTSPLYMLHLYDKVITSRSVSTLVLLSFVAVMLVVVYGLLDSFRSRLLIRSANNLESHHLPHLLRVVLKRTARFPQEPLIRSFVDLQDIKSFFSGTGFPAFLDFPWTFLFLFIVFAMHPVLGMVALVGALCLLIIAIASERMTRPERQGDEQKFVSQNFLSSAMNSAEAVNAMSMMGRMVTLWNLRTSHYTLKQEQSIEKATSLLSASKAARILLQIAMLGVGCWLVLQEEITPAVMIASSIIMARALAPVEQAIGAWRSFVTARQAMGRLTTLFAQEPTEAKKISLPRPNGPLVVDQVTVVSPLNGQSLLKSIRFGMSPGEVLGIVGPSGAGKSILGKTLLGLLPVQTGSIRLDETELEQWPEDERGAFIGYLPQNVQLIEGTVAQNIARFAQLDAVKIVEAAKLVGIHEFILRLPDGYETIIGPNGVMLSGGQQQRIALARAFYNTPAFVILDEPDANLDKAGEQALCKVLAHARQKKICLIVISHRPHLIEQCDLLVTLQNGQMEQFGPARRVLEKLRQSRRNVTEQPQKAGE